jgi:hypothetical protein|tara:strand:+ start:7576 stop:8622 length:1047 start_codon:yes stop_codon:yes gene_type:complete
MLGTYYYHEILRKTVIAFGTLFNDIHIRHQDNKGKDISDMKVALAYGPMQKFLARIEQQPELNRSTQITLPRMSFEMTNITYDATRKAGITQTFKASDGSNLRKVFMPVPYNVGFELNVLVKLNDDGLQIVEQILPYFQPAFNLSVDLVSVIGEKRDISVVLDNISFQDDYEGDFATRRALIYTLNFTAKTYLFGPVADTPEGIIKKVQLDYHTTMDKENARRELRYVTTPQAVKDYDNDNTATLTFNVNTSQVRINVNDTSAFAVKDRIVIDSEVMQINEIPDATTLAVKRGFSRTIKAEHIENSKVNKLTTADDALIEVGDDFGFNETSSIFTDSLQFNPATRTDS